MNFSFTVGNFVLDFFEIFLSQELLSGRHLN